MSDIQAGDWMAGRHSPEQASGQAEREAGKRFFSLGDLRVFDGPNPLAPAPVVVCRLRTDAGVGSLISPARERLARAFPRFVAHGPDRLSGRDPAEAVGQLIAFWAKAALNEVRGFIDEADAASEAPGQAILWVGFHDPRIATSAIVLAVRAVRQALREAPSPFEKVIAGLAELHRLCRAGHPDYQARILMMAARRRNVPVLPFEAASRLWQFGWGCRGRVFFETASDADGFIGGRVAKSKTASKAVFRDLGLPTPPGALVSAPKDLPAAAAAVGWPCVAKPLDRGGGKGVTAGIKTLTDLEQAYAHARKFTSGPVLVEAFVPGDDYRLTVIDGKLVAATHRAASSVVGDGARTVKQLLEELNRARSANLVASAYLYPVALDTVLTEHLAQQGLSPDDVPERGRRVTLRSNANRSTGGVCFNVPDIHPELRAMAETLATGLSLSAVGIDYITSDIRRPAAETNGAFIEINTIPDMAVVIAGGMDEAEIGSLILGSLPGRIPVALVFAEAPHDELARAVGAAAASLPGVAWLCGEEAGLAGMRLAVSGMAAPERVRALLRHRAARAAVVVWSIADLHQFGAPVDKADLGVLYRAEIAGPWRRVVESTCVRLAEASDVEAAMAAVGSVLAKT